MKNAESDKRAKKKGKRLAWIFPAGVAGLYLAILSVAPDSAARALAESGQVFKQVALPLLFAFVMMVVLNLYVSPARVTHYLGSRAGIKGVFFSSVAGTLSMGPVMAWLPFLAAIREKGAADFYLANFLSSRAVKPVLLPVMIGYFGWRFSLVFTALNMAGALAVAAAVASIGRRRQGGTP